ncbi:MAG: hypothetical protein H8E66_23100, partial [Planctomycetes bacterium]|nr:hypothetical protein [Planctomycetota bacterium]
MSTPHNFSDDPNSFPGPPTKSSNVTIIVVAIAVIGGTLMLICGGVIFGVVMSGRPAGPGFELVMGEGEWGGSQAQPNVNQSMEVVATRPNTGAIGSHRRGAALEPGPRP